jgi:glycosyltransferase involved in cell wall biosynthesis
VNRKFVRYNNSEKSRAHIWHEKPGNDDIVLSVIIPTADAYRHGNFPQLLEQIASQTLRHFEIITVKGDNRQGRAINIGAALAQGEYLLTLDDDTSLLDRETFSKLVSVMETHSDIGMAGGNNVIPKGASPFIRRAMSEIPRRSWDPVHEITDSDLAEHPCLIMRMEVFKSIGGENELIPRGLDPYLREEFRKAGYRVVVVPDVIYSHLPPTTFSKLITQFYMNGKQAAFCNKYYPQWVIETPNKHGDNFARKKPFTYRAARYAANMARNTLRGQWIYLSVSAAYAIGFIWGFLRIKDETR